MADMMKDNLCITCAKCKGINSDGYIKCPEFPTYAKAKETGMTVFLHCFCTKHVNK